MTSLVGMFQQRNLKIELIHISLALVGLMWTLPFLYGQHALPFTTFYQEWGAFVLGLCAMPLLLGRGQYLEIPRIVLLPIGLSVLILAQSALGMVAYFSQALLASLYLLWAALLVVLGWRLREQFGLPILATTLAAFLLLGAELSALAGVAQYYSWRNAFLDRVVQVKLGPGGLFGNVGQPNHFADYTMLGLVSLGLLRMRWQLRAWQVAPLAALLLFVLVLSGSRSAWLYLLAMAAMAFSWQRRDKSCSQLWHYSLLLLLGFGLMHLIVNIPWLAGTHGGVTTMGRLLDGLASFSGRNNVINSTWFYLLLVAAIAFLWQWRTKFRRTLLYYGLLLSLAFCLVYFAVSVLLVGEVTAAERLFGGGASLSSEGSVSARLHIWREAWLIFTGYPMLGAGFGQFPWQHFLLGSSLHNTNITGIYGSAHNIVMQTAAEMGLVGLAILFGTLALWVRRVRYTQPTIYHWWGYALLAVLTIHSLVEYPLWYAYFLGVAAFMLGVMDSATYRLRLQGVGRLSVTAILLFGAVLLSQIWAGHRKLEVVAAPMPVQDAHLKQAENLQRLMEIQGLQRLLLRPYIDLGLGESGWDHIADKRALNEDVMHFLPISPVAYREALLLAQAGLQAEAQIQMERAIWAYPEGFLATGDKLRNLASMDRNPERYPALLKFSLQKYADRQRMVMPDNR